ncbi:hypothetical protein DAEQUDRAFT_145791 [Daedalea quercina L-15889]|uniref:Uncharacterized protein n=1 Tax=Daedalea quercina L-15889 TaxID=1314783 RepID=A0A165KNT9_9APHY|nr:hypothetical protein DAEQUDRAFT_145791 [Daedalea quercina L-15889]
MTLHKNVPHLRRGRATALEYVVHSPNSRERKMRTENKDMGSAGRHLSQAEPSRYDMTRWQPCLGIRGAHRYHHIHVNNARPQRITSPPTPNSLASRLDMSEKAAKATRPASLDELCSIAKKVVDIFAGRDLACCLTGDLACALQGVPRRPYVRPIPISSVSICRPDCLGRCYRMSSWSSRRRSISRMS